MIYDMPSCWMYLLLNGNYGHNGLDMFILHTEKMMLSWYYRAQLISKIFFMLLPQ